LDRKLLISASPGEWRAALLEDGVPVELYVERGGRAEAGSIHIGRVLRLLPALDAALIDIAGDRPVFLPQREVFPRGRRLHEGERVVVQIRREAQGDKAARVTMAAILRGQLLEVIVRSGKEDGVELPTELGLAPIPSPAGGGGLGWALRPLAAAPPDALAAEAEELARRWRDILDRAARLEPPARLYPGRSIAAALVGSLPRTPSEILVDDPAAVPEIRAGSSVGTVRHLREAEWPIDLDSAFEDAVSETLALPEGGLIHFEATRAGTLVDVDTGTPEAGSPQRIALSIDTAAARSIARQIRLRNLGGGIVIDFVGLESRSARDKVRAALAEALTPDPRNPQLLGWTRLGHFELVRSRRGRPIAAALLEPRPGGALVKTAVTVSHEALRALRRAARAQPGRRWRLTVTPDVAAALSGALAAAIAEIEQRFVHNIVIDADPGGDREHFQISVF